MAGFALTFLLFLLFCLDNGHRLVTSGSVASDPIILHYGDNRMPRLANTDCGEGAKKPTLPDDKRDLVITPAGPMPREKVHPVGPNEIVRRNEDGTYTIVPKPDRRHKEERS